MSALLYRQTHFIFLLAPNAYRPEDCGRAAYKSSPHYSFGQGRPSDRYYSGFGTPGPGAYSSARHSTHKPEAPHYSLSGRHSWYQVPFIIEYKD